MAADRGEQAEARVAAVAERLTQLRERLARLRRGDPSTREDVVRARAAAARQRATAEEARRRLQNTYAAAVELRRVVGNDSRSSTSLTAVDHGRTSGGVHPVAAPATAPAADPALRQALVSIASLGDGHRTWPRERRQQLWQAVVDECGTSSWRGWNDALCRVVLPFLPDVRGLAVSGYDSRGGAHLLAVSDEWTRSAEEVAQLVGEGPASDAFAALAPVLVDDLEEEQGLWPGYVPAAVGAGVRTLAAYPVCLHGLGLGSITLYLRQPVAADGGWADYEFVSTVATLTLLADLDAIEQGHVPDGLVDDPVAVASGVLAVQLELEVDDALARLRAFAFSNARGLTEVARAVLDGSLVIA